IRLPQNRDHLLFGKSGLLHGSLVVRGAILSGFRWSEKDRAGQPDHYYYHCERNPEGFARLRAENFDRDEKP
ncbi:MAG: hypothetical protein WC815_17820, partial [Vicinamibacterales bacterium]